MALSDPQIMQILSIAFLWVLFLSSLRFGARSVYALRPFGVAAVRAVRWKMDRHDWMRELMFAVDTVQMKFSAALCTPWSIPLLFGGMASLGVGVSLVSSGDIMILVARHPERWISSNQYLDWVGSMLGGLGMAGMLAAVSRRRTASFLISSGFAITGLGIGIIAAVYI